MDRRCGNRKQAVWLFHTMEDIAMPQLFPRLSKGTFNVGFDPLILQI